MKSKLELLQPDKWKTVLKCTVSCGIVCVEEHRDLIFLDDHQRGLVIREDHFERALSCCVFKRVMGL